jgi:hypothetical protein
MAAKQVRALVVDVAMGRRDLAARPAAPANLQCGQRSGRPAKGQRIKAGIGAMGQAPRLGAQRGQPIGEGGQRLLAFLAGAAGLGIGRD